MSLKKEERDKIKAFIISNLEDHPRDIISFTADEKSVSRTTIHNYIKQLIEAGIMEKHGETKDVEYSLVSQKKEIEKNVDSELKEDRVWINEIKPILPELKDNVLEILEYGFTEMLNNVIDHSEADTAILLIEWNMLKIKISIIDNGIGIFRKIQEAFQLENPRDSILELAKGKLTTDPERHTGEGIFFTSRMMDTYYIVSDSIDYYYNMGTGIIEENPDKTIGTSVVMVINRNSDKEMTEVFDYYTAHENDFGFDKTIFPIKLAQYEGTKLISRSQAKRITARFDQFKEVGMDFQGVDSIGQAFADQIFRVFANQHPQIKLFYLNAIRNVERMILRAQSKQ